MSDVIAEQVLERAEVAVSHGAEVEIIPYAAQSYSRNMRVATESQGYFILNRCLSVLRLKPARRWA